MALSAERDLDVLNNRWVFTDDADPEFQYAIILPATVSNEAGALAYYTGVESEVNDLAAEMIAAGQSEVVAGPDLPAEDPPSEGLL